MHLTMRFQGIEQSPWMEKFMTKKVIKLFRFLNPSARIDILIEQVDSSFTTTISIASKTSYSFSSQGENLYESFSQANEKAALYLAEQKRRKQKEKLIKMGREEVA